LGDADGSARSGDATKAATSLIDARALTTDDADDSPEPPPLEEIALAPGQALETVSGVPLEAGERVLFYSRARHTTHKVAHILVGILLAPLIVGIAFLVYGILYERWHLRFVAITTKRIITKKGDKPARWLRLGDVVDVRVRGASGAMGAGAAANATSATSASASADKTDPKFWRDAEAIIVQGKKGALSIDRSVAPGALGPAIANALWTDGYLERVPTANHPS
jgi:hypothetical protein